MKRKPCWFFCWPLFVTIGFFTTLNAQQSKSVLTGVVQSVHGESLKGVVVIAEHVSTNTWFATVTDEEGHYTLEDMMPSGSYSLKVNYAPYQSTKLENISLDGKRELRMNIALNDPEAMRPMPPMGKFEIPQDIMNDYSERAGKVSKKLNCVIPVIGL